MQLNTGDKVLTGVVEEIFVRITEMIKDKNLDIKCMGYSQ